MKKLISILLTITMACSIMATSSFALGDNAIIDEGNGVTTLLVSSDRVEGYLESLQRDHQKCVAHLQDWYGEGSKGAWKGYLSDAMPALISFAVGGPPIWLTLKSGLALNARIERNTKTHRTHTCLLELKSSQCLAGLFITTIFFGGYCTDCRR